jgi:hypothetical protein
LVIENSILKQKVNNSSLNAQVNASPTIGTQPFSILKVNNWFLIAESKNFKIFFSGRDGAIASVAEKQTGNLYPVPESCELQIPVNEKKANNYFNNSVGINRHGAYKIIETSNSNTDTFTQFYESAGCSAKEGTIKLSSKDSQLICDIKIKYQPQSCN